MKRTARWQLTAALAAGLGISILPAGLFAADYDLDHTKCTGSEEECMKCCSDQSMANQAKCDDLWNKSKKDDCYAKSRNRTRACVNACQPKTEQAAKKKGGTKPVADPLAADLLPTESTNNQPPEGEQPKPKKVRTVKKGNAPPASDPNALAPSNAPPTNAP